MKNFISNEDLVNKFFKDALQEKHILQYLLVIVSLVKKYGHKLNIHEWYLQVISTKEPDIAKLYSLLYDLGKANIKDLNDIIKICKKIHVQYRKEFTITSALSTQKKLSEYINKNFTDTDVSFHEKASLGIDLKGEWYRYHRDLNRDLDIILS